MTPVLRGAAAASAIAGRVAAIGFAALMVLTPLALGGVPRPAAALAGVVAFAVALAVLAERALAVRGACMRLAAWPLAREHRLLLALVLGALVIAGLALVPLPRGVLAVLAPSTARLLDEVCGVAAPGVTSSCGSPASWHPLSLAPADSIAALVRLLAVLAVMGAVSSSGSFGERGGGARSPRPAALVLTLVALAATITSTLALVQQATWNGRIWWMLTPTDWAGQVPDGARASGPFVNPDHFAAFAWLGAVAGAALVVQARFATNRFTPRMRDVLSVGGAAAVVTCGLGVVASGCRTATAAALAVAVLWLWLARRWRAMDRGTSAADLARGQPAHEARRARRWVLQAVVLAALAALAWLGSRNTRTLTDRWVTVFLGGFGGAAFSARTAVWSGTAAMIEAFPMGVGLGAWPVLHSLFVRPPAHGWSWRHAHSEPLELVAEVGLLGGLVFAAALIQAGRAVLRRHRDEPPHELSDRARWVLVVGLAGTALHACVDFPLRAPACALALAALVGAGLRRRGDLTVDRVAVGASAPRERRAARWAWTSAGVVAALVLAAGLASSLAELSPRFSRLRLGPARAEVALGLARAGLSAVGGPAALPVEQAETVAAAFRGALAASPASAEAHHGVAVTTPDALEAARELAIAATLAPWNALYQDQLAMLELARGDDERARYHVARAVRAAPELERHPYLARGGAAGLGTALADAVEAGLTRAFHEGTDPRLAGSSLARFHEQRGAPAAQGEALMALSEVDPGERRWLLGAVRAFRHAGEQARADAAEARLLDAAGGDRVAAEIALALDVYVPLGSLDRATAIVDLAERREGPRGSLELARGRIALARHDGTAAVSAFQRGVERMPGSTEAALLLASALRAEHRSSESLVAYRRALDLGADTPAVWAAIGDLHELRREYRQAVEAYRAVLRDLPDDRRIHDALTRAERRARGESAPTPS